MGSSSGRPAGDEEDRARTTASGLTVNSRNTTSKDQTVNVDHLGSREPIAKQMVGQKETAKASNANGTEPSWAQTGKQTTRSVKTQIKLSSKDSGASGSRFAVL